MILRFMYVWLYFHWCNDRNGFKAIVCSQFFTAQKRRPTLWKLCASNIAINLQTNTFSLTLINVIHVSKYSHACVLSMLVVRSMLVEYIAFDTLSNNQFVCTMKTNRLEMTLEFLTSPHNSKLVSHFKRHCWNIWMFVLLTLWFLFNVNS